MSWLYSQALVEEYSAANCLDGEPCAQLNVMPTPQPFWRNDKTMEHSQLSRFGLTCAVLTAAHGAALLTWFLAGFHVRTSQSQEKAQESTGRARAFGERCLGLFAKFDRDLSLWRTPQRSLVEGLDVYSETWPYWGLMLNGECWEQTTWAHLTAETDYGLLPTPTTMDDGGRFNRSPTPGAKKRPTLGAMARYNLWPTPTVHGNTNAPKAGTKRGTGLQTAAGGPLNPAWVEWLMGWPLGWTELRPLEMDRFHNAPLRLSDCLTDGVLKA